MLQLRQLNHVAPDCDNLKADLPMKIFKAALGAIGLLTGINANAATIHHEKMDETTEVIGIFGDIVSADLERFRQISLRHPKAIVVLSSNGGLIYPAIEIGKIIKIMGYTTVVTDKDVCASACALIWMAGSNRVASYDGNVGFHASYRNESGKLVEVGAANALIGNYLTLLGESAKTVVFATAAPPDRILWLTAANKEAAGIDFHNFTPSQRQASSSAKMPPPVETTVNPPSSAPIIQASPSVVRPRAPTPDKPPTHWSDLFEAPPNWQWSNELTQPWVMLGKVRGGTKYYIDQQSFDKKSNTLWEFVVKFKHNPNSGKKELFNSGLISVYEELITYSLSCKHYSYGKVRDIKYGKYGDVISDHNFVESGNFRYNRIIDGSELETIYRAVCL